MIVGIFHHTFDNKKPFFTNLRYLEFTMLKLGTPRLFLAWIKEKFVIFLMGSLFFYPSPIAQTWDLLAFQFQSIAVRLARVIAWPCLKKYWIYQSYCKFHSNVSGLHKFACGSGCISGSVSNNVNTKEIFLLYLSNLHNHLMNLYIS